MLVLTRKQNEKIRIGNEITITVLRCKGKAIRLGIEAPAHINVLRGELVFDQEEASDSHATTDKRGATKPDFRKNAMDDPCSVSTKGSRSPRSDAHRWQTSPVRRSGSQQSRTSLKSDSSRITGPLHELAKAKLQK